MKRALVLAGFAAAGVAACWATVDAENGLTEPLVVRQSSAQFPIAFVHGDLPGHDAPDAGPPEAGDPDAGPDDAGAMLRITTIESQNNVIYLGESGKKLDGHVTDGAHAVGVRFVDLGSGYWSFPVDVADPQTPGELTWEALCDFSRTIPPGLHTLRFVPFDGAGVPGERRDLDVCIPSPTEGLHPCAPKKPVPAAVIELTWDRDVDLDLHVLTPDGKDVSPKHPSTSQSAGDAGINVDPMSDGTIDRDSNGACVIDGANREALSWAAYPSPGYYHLRVNLFDACAQPSVRFTIVVWVAEGDEGPGRHLVEKYRQSGILLDLDANAADQTGLFVSDFLFLEKETLIMIVERMLRIALLGSAWVMYLLLALSVLSVAAMVERALFFRRHRDDIDELTRRFHDAMASDDLFEADTLLARSPSLEAGVLRAGLRWIEGGSEVVMDVIASEMEKLRRRLDSGMTLLGTLGNNAPFIGLLGTVIGVIEAFHQLADTSNKGAMGGVMAGIAEALVATGVGLFVAIPAVVAFNIAQKKISDIEANVTSMAKLLAAIVKFREQPHHAMPRAVRDGESFALEHVEIHVEPRAPVRATTESVTGLPPRKPERTLTMAGSLSNGGGRRGGIVGINVTPMVDVVLVLLVIMMVSATYIVSQSLKVELPKTATSDDAVTSVAAVTITRDKKLYFNSEPTDEPALVKKLREAHAASAEVNLVVSADESVPHGQVVHVIDLAKVEGITKFAINVERSK